jgi:hypothetical protein
MNIRSIVGLGGFRDSDTSGIKLSYFAFSQEANDHTCAQLVECVSEQDALWFFDRSHPQLSDSGAFISARRDGDQLLAMRGNHGWSSHWIPITHEELVLYLRDCIAENSGTGIDSYELQLVRANRLTGKVDASPTADFRVFINERIAQIRKREGEHDSGGQAATRSESK